jgi:hypothetical protein
MVQPETIDHDTVMDTRPLIVAPTSDPLITFQYHRTTGIEVTPHQTESISSSLLLFLIPAHLTTHPH